MKSALLVSCLLAFVAVEAQAHKQPKCGSKTRNTVVSTVHLAGPRADERANPVFYFESAYHDVLFFRSSDAVRVLKYMIGREEAWRGEGKSTLKRGLLAEIEKNMPLIEHTDIKKYALLVPTYLAVAEELLLQLLRAGQVSVGNWNYFDPNPTSTREPTEKLKLYIVEDSSDVYSAEFCTESGSAVYFYACCIE